MVIALLLTGVTHGMLPQEYLDLSFSEVLSNSHVFALGKTTLTRGLGSNVQIQYGEILKISPWAYIFPKLFLRGLSMEGNLCFKFDSASLIVRGKFTVFALFSLYLRTIFQVQAPGKLILMEGQFNRGFFVLLVWGAFIWRGSFSEFYGMPKNTVSRNTP